MKTKALSQEVFFDFSTKNRNRKVENLKDKRRDIQEEIEDNKKSIRESLISILKLTEKLLEKEHALNVLKDTPIKTNRDKERLEDKIETIKDKIESIQDDIVSHNNDVKDSLKGLYTCIDKYNKINQELFAYTSSNRYNLVYSEQSYGIDVAKSISKNVKMRDSKSLVTLFRNYLE